MTAVYTSTTILSGIFILLSTAALVSPFLPPLHNLSLHGVSLHGVSTKLSHSSPTSSLYNILSYPIPKSFFTYFYVIPFLLLLLFQVSGIRQSHLSSLLFHAHCSRRLYECLNVHDFRFGTMTFTGFLVGSFHYVLTSFLYASIPSSTFSTSNYNLGGKGVGFVLFALGSLTQHRAHRVLAGVKRTKDTPYPPLPRVLEFKYSSCPHYLAEVIIYIALALTHQTNASVACLLWVAANLQISKMNKHRAEGRKGMWLWEGGWGKQKSKELSTPVKSD